MSSMGCLLSGINLLLNLSVKYNRICQEPERKNTTAYFAVYSIVVSIVSGGLFLLSVWGVIALMGAMDSAELGALLMWVFVAMLIIVALFLFAEYILGGLMGVVYQFRCNRRPIAWIALGVYIITAAAMVVGLIFIIDITGMKP